MRGHAQRHVERGGGQAVGGVGGEHDPLGRHAREQLDHVEREEAGDVVEHARMVGQARGEDPLVADRAVGEDQHGLGMAQGEVDEAVAPAAAVPRPAWIRIGTLAASASAKTPVHLRAVEHEGLGSRMQLDPARARRQAALALGQRIFGRVQAAEGDQSPVALAAPRRARGRWARDRPGWRSGSCSGNTHARRAPARRRAARAAGAGVSERPSSSSPRCVWASMTSASAGRRCSTSARNGARASAYRRCRRAHGRAPYWLTVWLVSIGLDHTSGLASEGWPGRS